MVEPLNCILMHKFEQVQLAVRLESLINTILSRLPLITGDETYQVFFGRFDRRIGIEADRCIQYGAAKSIAIRRDICPAAGEAEAQRCSGTNQHLTFLGRIEPQSSPGPSRKSRALLSDFRPVSVHLPWNLNNGLLEEPVCIAAKGLGDL